MTHCPVCGHIIEEKPQASLLVQLIDCSRCGRFKADRIPFSLAQYEQRLYLLSAIIREASEHGTLLTLNLDTVASILESAIVPDEPLEKMDRILLYVANRAQAANDYVPLSSSTDYPIAFARHKDEFKYFLSNIIQQGYLESQGMSENYRLTPYGWSKVAEIRRSLRDSSQAFVAMWFDPSMNEVWEQGFEPALCGTGYHPIRVDKEQFNDKIDDYIIARIQRSGLLVADVTGHRQGVYFEAGFAMGLGIPVIWTCREDQIEHAHFDTRQYNHIVWTDTGELRTKLINRIKATLPTRVQ